MLRKFLAYIMVAMAPALAGADEPWLHIYYPDGNKYQGFDMNDVLDITFDETTGTMFINSADGEAKAYAKAMDHFEIGPNVAAIYIDTDIQGFSEIPSKEEYLDATITFKGRGLQPDFVERVKIRGRGNSTWGMPKKPYRLKFEAKQRMLLPKKAKNFVLLANYIDPSMLRNVAALKFGEVIGMPWINHTEPVDVYFNNIYKGSYTLTEKVGFNNGSVNLKAADEPNSIMLELDTYEPADDDIYFESPYFKWNNETFYFPVKVKDPDAPADPDEADKWLEEWKEDFNSFVNIVNSGDETEIFKTCDLESLVRYIMVFDLSCNQELDHPKSVYVYKTKGGKWNFGPCWDFDWAFGYRPTYEKIVSYQGWWPQYAPSYENPLIGYKNNYSSKPLQDGSGSIFFYRLCSTEAFQDRFDEVWNDFYRNRLNEFWDAFDDYAERLRPSANFQGSVNSLFQKYDDNVEELREWLENRIEFINSDPNHGLFDSNTFNRNY